MRAWVATAVAAGLVVVGLVLLAAAVTGTPTGDFTRDPAALGNLNWYAGSVSVLNSCVWAVGAALSAFVAWIVPSLRHALVPLAALTALLGADDALRLHDRIAPAHGVPEMLIQAFYVLGGAYIAWRLAPWRRGREGEPGRAYLVGCLALAVSLGTDVIVKEAFLVEDGAKLVGALVWAVIPVGAYSIAAAERPVAAAAPVRDQTARAGR